MHAMSSTSILVLATAPSVTAQVPEADWIVHGGSVLTLDPEQPRVEAAAFAGAVVLALGALEDVLPLRGPRTRELDLDGRVLMPSFKDHHVHLLNLGLTLLNRERDGALQADLSGLNLSRIETTLAERCRQAPDGAWVTGAGWSQGVWGAAALPEHGPDRAFNRKDFSEIVVGACTLAVPLAVTEEVWDLGKELHLLNVLAIVAVSYAVIAYFVRSHFYRGTSRGAEYARRVLSVCGVTLLGSGN